MSFQAPCFVHHSVASAFFTARIPNTSSTI
uniref:Uncharacterized protein n=1 Tax=Anguilla anguilla TaxID=7936 RepID=A0A0E9QSY2_ANGAN